MFSGVFQQKKKKKNQKIILLRKSVKILYMVLFHKTMKFLFPCSPKYMACGL